MPAIPHSPCAMGLYFNGRISDGMAWTIEMVDSVAPIKMPPPTSISIDSARAEMAAPAKATSGGPAARYLRSRTSERRPKRGDRAACINRGACARSAVGSRRGAVGVRLRMWGTNLDDPAGEGALAHIANDKGDYRARGRDDENLRHDAAASQCDSPWAAIV